MQQIQTYSGAATGAPRAWPGIRKLLSVSHGPVSFTSLLCLCVSYILVRRKNKNRKQKLILMNICSENTCNSQITVHVNNIFDHLCMCVFVCVCVLCENKREKVRERERKFKFLILLYLQVRECTRHLSGSGATGTRRLHSQSGPSASSSTTWCAATSPSSRTTRFARPRSTCAAPSPPTASPSSGPVSGSGPRTALTSRTSSRTPG